MTDAKNAQTGPKFEWYRSKHDGQVHAALKFPKGYEDQHPEEYDGVESYDATKGDPEAQAAIDAAAADSRIDKSGYVGSVMAHIPVGSAEEPVPAASLVYGQPGNTTDASLPGHNNGGQVVVGGADRSMVRLTGEPPAPVEGTVNPADVAEKQIALNNEAKAALDNGPAAPAVPANGDGSGEDAKPSDGLTIPQIKEELDAKGIEYTSRETRDALAAKLDAAG